MRTLKKALSLVLVLAMVLSLGVTAFAADSKTFSDYDKVTNKEAVSVMSTLGIISGRDNGTYDPTATFNRAEAATIITRMLLGETVANALPVAATEFNDVPASHWASKYVAYCASEGIINGYGDGKFGPNDTLTATQWALMLLKAAKVEGVDEVGGSSWEISTTRLALNAKIATATELTGSFNRDMAAKMAFNGLNYSNNTETKNETKYVISKDGTTTIYNTFAEAQTALAGAMAGGTLTSINVTTEKKTDSIGYKVFGLETTVGADADNYGRPGAGYTYKDADGKTKTTAVFPKEPVAAWTTTVSANDLYNTLGANAVIDFASCKVNTTTQTASSLIASAAVSADINVAANLSGAKVALGGNGIVTEIYKAATDNHYYVVQIQPTLAKVTAATTRRATASVGAYTEYTIGGHTYKQFSTTVTSADKDTLTGTVAKNDWVMIYGYKDGETYYGVATPATTVTGKVTGYSSSAKSFTIDGTAYALSAATVADGATKLSTDNVSYTDSKTYAIDAYGNVVGTLTASANKDHVLVLRATGKQSVAILDGNVVRTVYQSEVITANGELQTITMSGTNAPGLYAVKTVSDKGVYTLEAADSTVTGNVTKLIKNNASLNDSNKYANSATNFYIAKEVKDGTEVTGYNVSSYTGIANVPSLDVAGNKAFYIDADKNGVAETVLVMPTSETVSDSFVYFTGDFSIENGARSYVAIVKGVETTMSGVTGVTTAGLYNVEDGTATKVAAKHLFLTFNGGVLMSSVDGNEYGIGVNEVPANTIGADVPVYVFDNGTCETLSASELSATEGDTVAFATSTSGSGVTTITAVYVVK